MTQRILLVEDELGLVMTLCDRLTSEGYTIETADSVRAQWKIKRDSMHQDTATVRHYTAP